MLSDGLYFLSAGSWITHSDTTGADHIYYYITVKVLSSNTSFQVAKRYSEFHALYLLIYNDLVKAFFRKGMENLFPNDRYSVWSLTANELQCNSRKEHLDAWLREICLTATVMLNLNARAKIYEFLEVGRVLSRQKHKYPS